MGTTLGPVRAGGATAATPRLRRPHTLRLQNALTPGTTGDRQLQSQPARRIVGEQGQTRRYRCRVTNEASTAMARPVANSSGATASTSPVPMKRKNGSSGDRNPVMP